MGADERWMFTVRTPHMALQLTLVALVHNAHIRVHQAALKPHLSPQPSTSADGFPCGTAWKEEGSQDTATGDLRWIASCCEYAVNDLRIALMGETFVSEVSIRRTQTRRYAKVQVDRHFSRQPPPSACRHVASIRTQARSKVGP